MIDAQTKQLFYQILEDPSWQPLVKLGQNIMLKFILTEDKIAETLTEEFLESLGAQPKIGLSISDVQEAVLAGMKGLHKAEYEWASVARNLEGVVNFVDQWKLDDSSFPGSDSGFDLL